MPSRNGFDSPVRPLRQPRFSTTGGPSPNENCPAHSTNHGVAASTFPRQFTSSPGKNGDRNVLLLLGNKINSSVPGRRSSIACSKDRKALAPVLAVDSDSNSDDSDYENDKKPRRSASLKTFPSTFRAHGLKLQTLKRL